MTEADRPVFILGLGAQKAGTTWFYNYLNHLSEVDMGCLKEYHVWDGLHVPQMVEFDARKRGLLYDALLSFGQRLRGRTHPDWVRRWMQQDPDRYFDYFAERLAAPGIRLTGDITPSYSALPEATLQQIAQGFEARGIAVKVVFFMRDPIERCHSAVRMYKRKEVSMQGVDSNLADEAALLEYVRSDQAHLRTDYHLTLSRAQAIFDPKDIYVGLYETMFQSDAFDQLNQFFGLTPAPGFLDRKYNQTTQTVTLSDEIRTSIRAEFKDIYDYCLEHYPVVRDVWDTGDNPSTNAKSRA